MLLQRVRPAGQPNSQTWRCAQHAAAGWRVAQRARPGCRRQHATPPTGRSGAPPPAVHQALADRLRAGRRDSKPQIPSTRYSCAGALALRCTRSATQSRSISRRAAPSREVTRSRSVSTSCAQVRSAHGGRLFSRRSSTRFISCWTSLSRRSSAREWSSRSFRRPDHDGAGNYPTFRAIFL